MNENVKKYALQAGITFTDYGSGEFLDKDDIDTDRLEKFAILIVERCIDLSKGARREWFKRHFGVEE